MARSVYPALVLRSSRSGFAIPLDPSVHACVGGGDVFLAYALPISLKKYCVVNFTCLGLQVIENSKV